MKLGRKNSLYQLEFVWFSHHIVISTKHAVWDASLFLLDDIPAESVKSVSRRKDGATSLRCTSPEKHQGYLQDRQNRRTPGKAKGIQHVSHEKNLLTFHSTACLIGILIMVYYNPHIPGYNNPLYQNNQPMFFSLLMYHTNNLDLPRTQDASHHQNY